MATKKPAVKEKPAKAPKAGKKNLLSSDASDKGTRYTLHLIVGGVSIDKDALANLPEETEFHLRVVEEKKVEGEWRTARIAVGNVCTASTAEEVNGDLETFFERFVQ